MIKNPEVLKQYFTTQNPLGDIAAIENADDENRIIFQSYFDSENHPYKELRREPSMIVGRKGSGKTDALLSYRYGAQGKSAKFEPIIFFEANEAASVISTVINQITDVVNDNYPPPTVEAIADFWSNLFWITIMNGIVESGKSTDSDDLQLLKRFLAALFSQSGGSTNPYYTVISSIVGERLINAFGCAEMEA